MITKLYLCLIFLIFSAFADACKIELPQKLLIIDESADITNAFSHQECSQNQLREAASIIKSVDGKISNSQLTEILLSKNINAELSPDLMEIQHFKNLMRRQIPLPSGLSIKSSSSQDTNNFIALSGVDLIDIQCTPCLFGKNQLMNLTITESNGVKRKFNVKTDFAKMVKAYKLKSSQHAFSKVNPDDLEAVFVEAVPFTEFIDDLSLMKFYKFNKPVSAGDLIRRSDLTAENLVRAGNKTEVIIENELIRLKTSAIARNSGSFGDWVEVFHPQKNKKYNGKVIDLNKVLVEL